MAYTINDKLYTDNPLLDEVVYNVKLMLNGIVLKDCDDADNNETKESIDASDIYISIKRNNKQFYLFNYLYDDIKRIIQTNYPQDKISEDQYRDWAINNELIPDKYRQDLIEYYSEEYINNYVELNNYYRMLNGLEDYGFSGYSDYISENKIWNGYTIPENIVPSNIRSLFDFTLPISKYSNYQIGVLEKYGILDKLKKDYPDLLYLNHLGMNKIDIYDARIAKQFEVLYIPESQELINNRFREILDKNRIIYTKRHYSLAYKIESDYYNKIMILMIIAQSVTDLIVETPEWYIRRDIFDIRTVEYILTGNGVKFFPTIPLRYQISMVRILNRLIKYKSCNKNIFDLASIFNLDQLSVYKYYLMKSRKVDIYGDYITIEKSIIDSDNKETIVEDIENMYDLIFIKTPINESYNNYLNKNANKIEYDNLVYNDYYWDSINEHDTVKNQILDKKFTIQPTKYLSVEKEMNYKESQFQIQYMINLILNNSMDLSDLKLKVPIINTTSEFEIRDLFVLLYVISFSYYENKTKDPIKANNRVPKPIDFKPEIFIEGGHSYRVDPIYENMNGGKAQHVEDYHDDAEDLPDNSLDFDGSVSFGFSNYEDWNGNDNVDNISMNGGDQLQSTIQLFSGDSEYWYKPSAPFEEKSFDKEFPHVDTSNRLYGFNIKADLDYLKSIISIKIPHFDINGKFTRDIFTLEELGVEDFKSVKDKIKTPEELMDIYETNKKVHDTLLSRMKNNIQSRDEYDVYSFVYDYLFTFEIDLSYFTLSNGQIAKTYSEFLKYKNILLYEFYNSIMMENNLEQRQYIIDEYVNNIIRSITDYLNCEDNLDYMFYFVPSESWSTILNYLSLLLEFFKNFKSQFLEVTGSMMVIGNCGGSSDSRMHIYDNKKYIDIRYDKVDNINIFDMKDSMEIEFEWKDGIKLKDNISSIQPSYENKSYDVNGSRSVDRSYYFNIPSNNEINVDQYQSFDFEGNSPIEEEDREYKIHDEFNGGTPKYVELEDDIDNKTSLNRSFYADYCNN